MDILTHQKTDHQLCGTPLDVGQGFARIQLQAFERMAVDSSGLVHGGFVFGLADYAAMLAVNHPNVVLGAAEVTFLKPVAINETVVAEAQVDSVKDRKRIVSVVVLKNEVPVFKGSFTCFVLEKHVLD
jgi:acyl-coenzyme A thioesterase PaaI-like protein